MKPSRARRISAISFSLIVLAPLTGCSTPDNGLAEFLPSFCAKLENQVSSAATPRDVIRIADDNVYELELEIQNSPAVDEQNSKSSKNNELRDAANSLATSLNSISEAFFDAPSVSKSAEHKAIQASCMTAGVAMDNWGAKGSALLPAGVWNSRKWETYVQVNMQKVADSLVRYSCSPDEELFSYSPDTSLRNSMHAIFNGRPVFALWMPDDYEKKYRLSIGLHNEALALLNCPRDDFDNYANARFFDLREIVGVLVSQGQV